MKLKDIILTASSNMSRSKLRTALTILAVFIGAFTLTLTNGLGSGISSYVDKQVSNLGQQDLLIITSKSSTQTDGSSDTPQKYEDGKLTSSRTQGPPGSTVLLTNKDIDALKGYSQLSDVQPAIVVSPDYIEGPNNQKYQATMARTGGDSAKLDLAAGNQLSTGSQENQIVLPISFVSPLGFTAAAAAVGQPVTLAVTDAAGLQHSVAATVVGVQQKGLVGSGVVFNNALKDALYNLQSLGLPSASKNRYQLALAKIVGDTGDSHVKEIKSKLDGMGYTGETVQDQLGAFKTVIRTITYVLDAFAVIALLAASFGIVNTLLMSVQERTKEIGLMKAMGMRSSRIFMLFSVEAILLGFWGSVIGVAAAILLGSFANRVASNGFLKDLPGFNLLAFPLKSVALIVLLILAISFIAGTLPARRAARQNPIDALRYE